eukprot:7407702-Alexandrium_andersonii.AAC.1
MHVLFANGVVPAEIFLLLEQARKRMGVHFKDLRAFASEWHWPRTEQRRGWNPNDLFSEARAAASQDTFKATASE